MGVDRMSVAGADEASGATGRGIRNFGLLRRHDPGTQVTEPGSTEVEPQLPFSLDPDVARRIALYVDQQPGDTDLTWLLVR